MAEGSACTIREYQSPVVDVHSLDLDKCGALEISFPLNEFDRGKPQITHATNSWPEDVRAQIYKIRDEWLEKNKNRVIRMQSSACWRGVALLVLHHGPID